MSDELSQAALLQLQQEEEYLAQHKPGTTMVVEGQPITTQPTELGVLQFLDKHRDQGNRNYSVRYEKERTDNEISYLGLREWAMSGLIRILVRFPVGTNVRILDEKKEDIVRLLNWPLDLLEELQKLPQDQIIGLDFADGVDKIKQLHGLPVKAFSTFFLAVLQRAQQHMAMLGRTMAEFPNVYGLQMGLSVCLYDPRADADGDGVLFSGSAINKSILKKVPPEQYKKFFAQAEEALKNMRAEVEGLIGPLGDKGPDLIIARR